MQAQLIKIPSGVLVPSDETSIDALKTLPTGQVISADITQPRNPRFHRKLMALIRYLYDNTDRIEAVHDNKVIGQSFDAFREGLIIMSGHHHLDVLMNGALRYKAHSISFAKCSEEKAQTIYKDIVEIACEKMLKDIDYQRMDSIINDLVQF